MEASDFVRLWMIDEFDVISSAAEPLSAQLPVMPSPIFPGIADKVLDQLTADFGA